MSNTTISLLNSTDVSEASRQTEWDVSEDLNDLTNLLTYQIFGTLLSSLGIFGNICTIIVLWRKKDKSKITIFIMALAMADVAALSFFLVFCVYRNVADAFDPLDFVNFVRIHYYYISYIMRVPKSITNFFTVVIAFERLYSVINPGASRASSSKTRGAIFLSIAITILTIIICLPFALEFSYKTVYSKDMNRYIVITTFTTFGTHREFFFIYYILINAVLTILSVVTTLICNVILIVFLIKRSKMTIGTTSSQSMNKREISTTKTLLIISFVFVICITPAAVYFPVKAMNIFRRETYINRVLFAWVNFFELVNHFANPPLFYFTSSEFRRAYQNLFRKNSVTPTDTTSSRGPATQTSRF